MYSSNFPPIEHIWDFFGLRLTPDRCPLASTDELWLQIQMIRNVFPPAAIQNMFDYIQSRVAARIAIRCGDTGY